MYVLSSQTRGSKSQGSATDANANMYRNPKDSVVCGMREYAHRTPMKPPMPTFSSIPSCESFGNRQLVCASSVPSSNCPLHEHLLSSHRGRLLLFHGHVFLCRSSRPPTDLSERIVHFAKEVCVSSMKASKAATSMVYHVGRAPEHGAGQGIE